MGSEVEVLAGSDLDELLRAARRDVAGLEDVGFAVTGGVRFRTRGFKSRAVLLVGPTGDRTASVALTAGSAVFAIGSSSRDGRRLVSRAGSTWETPVWELCNDLPGASPRQLNEAHSEALELVRDGFEPVARSQAETIDDRADHLRAYLELVEGERLIYMGGSGYGPLTSNRRSSKRIAQWNSARPPSTG